MLAWLNLGPAILVAVVLARGVTLDAAQPERGDADRPRVRGLSVPRVGRAGFTLMAPDVTGVLFTNRVAQERSLTNHILLNGSGVAAGDVDGDGWCDLYFCGLDGPNALYRNLGGWRFENIAARAGAACPGLDATGAVLADLDGDGDLDLLVSAIRHGVTCFLNDGHGRFEDVTAASGLASTAGSMSMALADVDGDGDLDLYVANYRSQTLRDGFRMQLRVRTVEGRRIVTMVNGRPLTDPDLVGWVTLDNRGNITENGEADVLYRNDGNAHFTALTHASGWFLDEYGRPLPAPLFDWTLTGMFRDLNGDGAPDLYVCSDMSSPDRIWINRGDGHFQAARGTAFRKTSWFSMGLDCGDLNRDGFDEILVTDMVSRDHRLRQVQVSDHQPVYLPVGAISNRPQAPRNTLFLSCGDGDYLETAYYCGLDASEWSWSPVFLDVDLDGFEDVLVATGFERDVQDIDIARELEAMRRDQRMSDADALRQRARFPRLELPNLAFHNRGDLTFEEAGPAWGFNTPGVSQGVALADLDNDGDLDVIVNNLNAAAGLYRNESCAPRLAVRLKGQPPNTRGIGARLEIAGGAVPRQSQEMQSGGRYLSSDDPMRVFAVGTPTNRLSVEVAWRSGRRSHLADVGGNQVVEMVEPSSGPALPASAAAPSPIFEDRSRLLAHPHAEESFDDFARQPLLPRKLSQLGPGVSWFDLDGDGWDDLLIASGRGGAPGVFRNDGQGGFKRFSLEPLLRVTPRDQTTLLGGCVAPGRNALWIGTANYEDGRREGASVQQYDPSTGEIADVVPASDSSAGPLALADVDGDGDLDLFVGGRVVPGRYPEPASSRLFRNEAGRLVPDPAADQALRDLGLVSGALWTDLDGDGFAELVLACDWGPLRIFRNQRGRLVAWDWPLDWAAAAAPSSRPESLGRLTGWWNGVAAGDFDGDGRMDLVASNWGLNNKYQRYLEQPLRLYYGDFTGSGGVDLLEAYFFPPLGKVVPWQHLGRIGPALPFTAARFATYREFGSAGIDEILGEQIRSAREVRANWLATTLLLNRGDRFEPRALPVEAQLSPAFALCVADLNLDGNEDLFLSQNFFDTEPETGRYDSGRGLWLLGDGRGGFRVLPATESGVRVYGEQRGAAIADYDRDGRVDLCVSQNGAAVCLFRNVGGPAGIRVRLRGPPSNPAGIGAQLDYAGPNSRAVKELHAGSGYWSQDSATLVLPRPAAPVQLNVRWPGGQTTSMQLPPDSSEVEVFGPKP